MWARGVPRERCIQTVCLWSANVHAALWGSASRPGPHERVCACAAADRRASVAGAMVAGSDKNAPKSTSAGEAVSDRTSEAILNVRAGGGPKLAPIERRKLFKVVDGGKS